MKRKKTAEPPPRTTKESGPEVESRRRIIERPDGFYWVTEDTKQQNGPFATLAEAEEDTQSGGNELEPGESLQEAESELGISDWIDPDTGGPAEDNVPHIEDH